MPKKAEVKLDQLDLKILDALQNNSDLSLTELSEIAGLSSTPCWRRIKRLEEHGIIEKRVALLNRCPLNLGVTVFVSVRTNAHNEKWLEQFAAAVERIPEVVEFYRMSGDIDYLLKVVVPDIDGYDAFYKKLIQSVDLSDVSSSFAMEQIKYTTALPLTHAQTS